MNDLGLKAALEYLCNIGADVPRTVAVHQDDETVEKIVSFEGFHERLAFDREPVEFSHSFLSLEAFLEFLNGPECAKASGVVFVGERAVTADLYYLSHTPRTAHLKLDFSEEFLALIKIFFAPVPTPAAGEARGDGNWTSSKDLWRLLVSDLDGCLPDSLTLAVKSLQICSTSVSDMKISDLGIGDGGGSTTIDVSYKDKSSGEPVSKEIDTDYVWHGRVFETFASPTKINLRMEMDVSDGVRFTFHPRRMREVMRVVRANLVEHIGDGVKEAKRFVVYEGTP